MDHLKLPLSFYQQDDVLSIAQQLLGKKLVTQINGLTSAGIIVETEAYCGPEDVGSHAYNNKRTVKNEMMYAAGGVVYMYICYGIHDMLNIVTGSENCSHAVLIRALQPFSGLEIMRERRNLYQNDFKLCKGPGALAKAMGLTKLHNGISLLSDTVWIESMDNKPELLKIQSAPRIGLNIPEPYKSIAWRYYLVGNKFVSRK